MADPLPFDPARKLEIPERQKRKGFTARQTASVFIKFDGRCAACAAKVGLGGYQIDHVVPVISGGAHELENWQLLCVPCHKPKTKTDNAEAKKCARLRRETGQQARRDARGPSIKTGRKLQSAPVSTLSKSHPNYRKPAWGKR